MAHNNHMDDRSEAQSSAGHNNIDACYRTLVITAVLDRDGKNLSGEFWNSPEGSRYENGRQYVYVISTLINGKHKAPVKIGIATDAKKRLSGLQTASATDLVLTFAFPIGGGVASIIEQSAHTIAKKRNQHLRGEWFDLHPARAIDLVCKTIGGMGHVQGLSGEYLRSFLEISGVIDAYVLMAEMWPDGPPRDEESIRRTFDDSSARG